MIIMVRALLCCTTRVLRPGSFSLDEDDARSAINFLREKLITPPKRAAVVLIILCTRGAVLYCVLIAARTFSPKAYTMHTIKRRCGIFARLSHKQLSYSAAYIMKRGFWWVVCCRLCSLSPNSSPGWCGEEIAIFSAPRLFPYLPLLLNTLFAHLVWGRLYLNINLYCLWIYIVFKLMTSTYWNWINFEFIFHSQAFY